jgi:hypothetical protein
MKHNVELITNLSHDLIMGDGGHCDSHLFPLPIKIPKPQPLLVNFFHSSQQATTIILGDFRALRNQIPN